MRSTRTIPLVAAVAALVFVFSAAPVSAATKAPVKLGQKVNIKGTKDVSSKSSAKIEMELDDKYFDPTFIKAKAGEKITLEMENEGSLPHTFTSGALAVDQQVDPGKKAKLTFAVPSDGVVFQFHCAFHESAGMAGGVYTKAGASATETPTPAATNSSSGSGSYGY
jgi:plastocyanin